MKSREYDPARLDLAAFVKDQVTLEGVWTLKELDRLRESVLPEANEPESPVKWSMTGEQRTGSARDIQTWLHLSAEATVHLECQRCLKPVAVELVSERSFRFVEGEDAAAALDSESDDDVLEMTRWLDARELAEDELLLSLPIVPRHEECPDPLPEVDTDLPEDDTPHPFAALAALKRGGMPN